MLTRRERLLLWSIAEAALPAGKFMPAAKPSVVEDVDRFLEQAPTAVATGYRALLRSLDAHSRLRYFRSLDNVAVDKRLNVLHSWRTGSVSRRLAMRGLLIPLKVAHFDSPELYKQLGCVYEFDSPKAERKPRYMVERTHDATKLDQDLELEVDVVVIGSGAGGAVMARELAERGHAVVLLEEGAYFDRSEFTGRTFDMQRKMYRNAGATFALGNAGIPIPLGRTVGGTTTINSGTCYRVPSWILQDWRAEGLTEFTEDMLAPYYERVENVLGVQEAQAQYLGGVARVIARGCEALGYDHKPLRRNAPDCDGKGVCCWGCPTDAKRSTNVSYVPLALKAGAELFHGARATEILQKNGRAVGVRAVTADDKGAHAITVHARAVVVACGSLITPAFLMGQGLAGGSGQLGRNLSIHPALASGGLFDETIAGYNGIPQGYAIEEFHREGLLFEGAATPLDISMAASPFLGKRLIELAESYDRLAAFGFMVKDSSRGRVRSLRGRTVITYMLNDRDVARLKRGQELLSRVFFAAGAQRVYTGINGHEVLQGEADLARLRRAKLKARDLDLTAYHPLGTARMGVDPARSVIDPEHRCHDVPGLYIVDGSSLPSSPAVNPQVTIMAMATRAAELLHRRLARR